MIGFISRMYSPSIVHSRRSTPCVAGWWGPRLIVKSSFSGSSWVPKTGAPTSSVSSKSLIPARHLVLVEGEQDRLAAHREVAALGPALVVLGHEDPAHVGVPLEGDAEHVVDLALLEVGGRVEVDDRRHRLPVAHAQLHVQAVEALHRQQLVVNAETRLLRPIVVPVHALDALEEVRSVVAEEREDVADRRRRDLERRVPVYVMGTDDRLVAELCTHLLSDQLEAGRVR